MDLPGLARVQVHIHCGLWTLAVQKHRQRRAAIRKDRDVPDRKTGVVIDELKQSDVVLPARVATNRDMREINRNREVRYLSERKVAK